MRTVVNDQPSHKLTDHHHQSKLGCRENEMSKVVNDQPNLTLMVGGPPKGEM